LTDVQKVKNGFFYKHSSVRVINSVFGCDETRYNVAMRPFGRCHISHVVCSKYLICLLFDQHTVDGISHKWSHIYHSLHISGFGSAGKFLFLPGYLKQLGPLICYLFHFDHKVHSACKNLTNLGLCFCGIKAFRQTSAKFGEFQYLQSHLFRSIDRDTIIIRANKFQMDNL